MASDQSLLSAFCVVNNDLFFMIPDDSRKTNTETKSGRTEVRSQVESTEADFWSRTCRRWYNSTYSRITTMVCVQRTQNRRRKLIMCLLFQRTLYVDSMHILLRQSPVKKCSHT
jgi:hypothetical protein